jgi:hypothetical protein
MKALQKVGWQDSPVIKHLLAIAQKVLPAKLFRNFPDENETAKSAMPSKFVCLAPLHSVAVRASKGCAQKAPEQNAHYLPEYLSLAPSR